MTVFVDKPRRQILLNLIDQLEAKGLNIGYSRRLSVGGEWGLCFQEICYVAKVDDAFFESNRAVLEAFDIFFTADPYLAKHCGFPVLPKFFD